MCHFEPSLEVVQVSVSFLIATLALLIGASLDKVKDAIDLRITVLRVTMHELLIGEEAFRSLSNLLSHEMVIPGLRLNLGPTVRIEVSRVGGFPIGNIQILRQHTLRLRDYVADITILLYNN